MNPDLLATLNTEPVRFSRLKRIGQSPAHYAANAEYSSDALELGNAADAAILGGTVVAYPGAVRRGKEWEQWQKDQNPAAILVTKAQAAATEGMVKAVQRHPEAMRLLDGVRRETLYWTRNGRSCRGTPDVRTDAFLTDLKTGETSDPRRFGWKVRDYCYHGQLAWYRDGIERCGLPVPEETYIVAVEQKPPHVVTVFKLTDHLLDMGLRLCTTWFEHLRLCEESGRFPGYSESVVELDLPDPDEEFYEMVSAGGAA